MPHSTVQPCPTARYSLAPQYGTALPHSTVQPCPTARYSLAPQYGTALPRFMPVVGLQTAIYMLLCTWPLHSYKSCSCHSDRLRTLGTTASCQRTEDRQISCGNLSPDKSDAMGATWTGVMTATRRLHRSDRATMVCSPVFWLVCVSAPNGNRTLFIRWFAYPSTPNGNQLFLRFTYFSGPNGNPNLFLYFAH